MAEPAPGTRPTFNLEYAVGTPSFMAPEMFCKGEEQKRVAQQQQQPRCAVFAASMVACRARGKRACLTRATCVWQAGEARRTGALASSGVCRKAGEAPLP